MKTTLPPGPSRRAWLKSVTASVAGFFLFQIRLPASAGIAPGPYGAGISQHLARLFRNYEGVTAVGKKYLACIPFETDAEKLAQQALPGAENTAMGAGEVGYDQFKAVVHSRVRDDFRQGRVINLDGWVLSETEVRLCSLLALQRGEVTSL